MSILESNIHPSELLRTKIKEFWINKHKFFFKNGQFTFNFYLNNILTRLFIELKKKNKNNN